MRKTSFRMIVVFVSVLLPAAALAASFSAGSVGTVPGLIPNPANGYNGQYLGIDVRGWLYPADMKTPPDSQPTFGQFGTTKYAMILNRASSSGAETGPLGVDESGNSRAEFQFRRTLSRKLLRIVVDSRQDKLLESELLSADKPIALEGQVSDSASPILTVRQVAEPKANDAAPSAMSSANPVASRSSQMAPN